MTLHCAVSLKFILIVLFGLFVNLSNEEVSKKSSNRYLKHIFNKYGSHGTINFEVKSGLIIDFELNLFIYILLFWLNFDLNDLCVGPGAPYAQSEARRSGI